MAKYITSDDPTKIRSELEEVQRAMQRIFSRLKSLGKNEISVTRAEAALAAIERVLWTVTSEGGGLSPSVPIRAILSVPFPLNSVSPQIACDPLLLPGSLETTSSVLEHQESG